MVLLISNFVKMIAIRRALQHNLSSSFGSLTELSLGLYDSGTQNYSAWLLENYCCPQFDYHRCLAASSSQYLVCFE